MENFTKVKGTARRIKAFPEIDGGMTSLEGEVGEHERAHTEFDIRTPNSPSGEGEIYELKAYPMNFVTSSTYSESNHWAESPQQGGASVEGLQSPSPRAGELDHSLHL